MDTNSPRGSNSIMKGVGRGAFYERQSPRQEAVNDRQRHNVTWSTELPKWMSNTPSGRQNDMHKPPQRPPQCYGRQKEDYVESPPPPSTTGYNKSPFSAVGPPVTQLSSSGFGGHNSNFGERRGGYRGPPKVVVQGFLSDRMKTNDTNPRPSFDPPNRGNRRGCGSRSGPRHGNRSQPTVLHRNKDSVSNQPNSNDKEFTTLFATRMEKLLSEDGGQYTDDEDNATDCGVNKVLQIGQLSLSEPTPAPTFAPVARPQIPALLDKNITVPPSLKPIPVHNVANKNTGVSAVIQNAPPVLSQVVASSKDRDPPKTPQMQEKNTQHGDCTQRQQPKLTAHKPSGGSDNQHQHQPVHDALNTNRNAHTSASSRKHKNRGPRTEPRLQGDRGAGSGRKRSERRGGHKRNSENEQNDASTNTSADALVANLLADNGMRTLLKGSHSDLFDDMVKYIAASTQAAIKKKTPTTPHK